MKNLVSMILGVILFMLLMILPGFVFYIVGDLANKMIPDKNEKGGAQ